MRRQEDRDEILMDVVITKLFNCVGLDWDMERINSFVSKKDWWLEHSWSEETESRFKDWLIIELLKRKRCSKKLAEKEARMFLFNYGWKTNHA